jgi:hypothetical protein
MNKNVYVLLIFPLWIGSFSMCSHQSSTALVVGGGNRGVRQQQVPSRTLVQNLQTGYATSGGSQFSKGLSTVPFSQSLISHGLQNSMLLTAQQNLGLSLSDSKQTAPVSSPNQSLLGTSPFERAFAKSSLVADKMQEQTGGPIDTSLDSSLLNLFTEKQPFGLAMPVTTSKVNILQQRAKDSLAQQKGQAKSPESRDLVATKDNQVVIYKEKSVPRSLGTFQLDPQAEHFLRAQNAAAKQSVLGTRNWDRLVQDSVPQEKIDLSSRAVTQGQSQGVLTGGKLGPSVRESKEAVEAPLEDMPSISYDDRSGSTVLTYPSHVVASGTVTLSSQKNPKMMQDFVDDVQNQLREIIEFFEKNDQYSIVDVAEFKRNLSKMQNATTSEAQYELATKIAPDIERSLNFVRIKKQQEAQTIELKKQALEKRKLEEQKTQQDKVENDDTIVVVGSNGSTTALHRPKTFVYTKDFMASVQEATSVVTDLNNPKIEQKPAVHKTFVAKIKHLFNKYANKWRESRGKPTVSSPELDQLADVGVSDILQLKGKATVESVQAVFSRFFTKLEESNAADDFDDYDEVIEFDSSEFVPQVDKARSQEVSKYLGSQQKGDHSLGPDPYPLLSHDDNFSTAIL